MNDEEVCNVIKGLLNKLYEVANKYNDRSCDEDVCHEVRNARIMLGRLGIYQYRMYADYDYLEVK